MELPGISYLRRCRQLQSGLWALTGVANLSRARAPAVKVQAPRERSRGAASSPEVVEALRKQLQASEAELRRVRQQVLRCRV